MAKSAKYSQHFKEDAVQFDLTIRNYHFAMWHKIFGISESALKNWMKSAP